MVDSEEEEKAAAAAEEKGWEAEEAMEAAMEGEANRFLI